MKFKNIAINSLFYFLYVLGASLVIMLAEWLFVFIIQKFAPFSYPVLTVIRMIIYTVGVGAVLVGIGYMEGYRSGHHVGESILGVLLGSVYHLLFSLLFHFDPFISGGVRFTAGLLEFGGDVSKNELLHESSTELRLIVFAGYTVLYMAILTLMRYVGSGRRVEDRAELYGQEPPADGANEAQPE